ncbi:hypothetical protein [Streptomyces rishiriensis]|uniref:Uncharacterized protein n=1 Tax=Streptomyces rishiriensis TaxID=68264 RepID=A0ABU0NFH2_STRRH|nr:hypothetical protein [Streptomyces rishiriensis]MDQ0577846.1 hypothetical protein [Streptomyces rishiriensis]
MTVATLQRTGLVLDAELVEAAMTPSEAEVSGAPLPSVEGDGLGLLALVLLLSPKEPKEPRRR